MKPPLHSRSGLSIRSRMVIGYTLIMLLVILASVLALVHMQSAEMNIRSITEGWARIVELAEFRIQWDRIMITLDHMILTRQRSMADSEMESSVAELRDMMDSLLMEFRRDGAEEDLEELRECVLEAVAAADSIGAAVEQGRWASAQLIHHTEMASIQRRLERNLNDIREDTAARVMRSTAAAAATRGRMRKGLMAAVVLALLVGFIASLLTASSIIRPIEYLAASVRSLTPEGLQHKLDVSRNDEIGELAEAFNSMTDRLHTALRGLEEQIEAYREVQEALRLSEARYRSLFQHAPISLWELDVPGMYDELVETCCRDAELSREAESEILDRIRVVDVNMATLDLLSAPGADDLRNTEAFLTEDMRRILMEAVCAFAGGGSSFSSETVLRNLSGETKHVIAYFAVPPGSGGESSRVFLSLQDITAERRVERALRRSEEQYFHAQKMEAVGRLTGGIAHDFNNLLTVILSSCDIALLDRTVSPETGGHLERIRGAASRAASVTEQLLSFSHQQISNPTTIDVNVLLAEVIGMLRHTIGEDIQLVTEFSPDLPGISADPGQLQQVILNLAVNARDAMPEGGILTISTSITGPSGKVRTDPGESGRRHVLIRVEDTGTGMEQDVRERAFDPFFTTKERGKGTGLGLASVQRIITDIGGNVEVDTEPGRGTVFMLSIPSVEEKAGIPGGGGAVHEFENEEGTVLLVEDDKSLRDVISHALRLSGYMVLEASDCRSALEAFEEHRDGIDLVVSDVVLPGRLNGIQIAGRLRSSRPGLRVLLMSGYAMDSVFGKEGLPPGTEYLAKPFSLSVFLQKVRETRA